MGTSGCGWKGAGSGSSNDISIGISLDGGLQVTGGFRHLKKGKDININYHKVLERSFFFHH